MVSINTNVAALMAMRSLQATNRSLATAQNRIATGHRIEKAADNPALWSTAAKLRSERKSLEAVITGLDAGAAQVDTAYKGLTKATETLGDMKSTFVAMMQPGANLTALNNRLVELQAQLKSIAASANLDGQNWLDVQSGSVKKIVSSINTAANKSVSFDTIDIDTSAIALRIGTTGGLLQEASVILYGATSYLDTLSNAVFDEAGDTYEFTVKIGDGAPQTLRIDRAAVLAVGNRNQTIDDPTEYLSIIQNLIAANPNLAGKVELVRLSSMPQYSILISREPIVLGVARFNSPSATNTDLSSSNIHSLNLTSGTSPYSALSFDSFIGSDSLYVVPYLVSWIDAIKEKVTTAAATLGSKANRITAQKALAQSRIDTIDKATGALVDADVTEEKTRLQALQAKQQLAIQALSIANTTASSILDLFKR